MKSCGVLSCRNWEEHAVICSMFVKPAIDAVRNYIDHKESWSVVPILKWNDFNPVEFKKENVKKQCMGVFWNI